MAGKLFIHLSKPMLCTYDEKYHFCNLSLQEGYKLSVLHVNHCTTSIFYLYINNGGKDFKQVSSFLSLKAAS